MPRTQGNCRSISRLLARLAIVFAFLVPVSAYASLEQCVKLATLFDLDDAKKAANFVSEHGQCIGDLSRPDFLAVVASVVLVEQLTGAYNNGNSCEAALGGVAGKPIALALSELASVLNLPEDIKNQLISYASNEGSQGLIQFMETTPGLNVIASNWSCACAVRYSGIAEKLQEILENLAGCTGGILESGLDGVGNFYDDLFGGPGHAATGEIEYYGPTYCQAGWVSGTSVFSYEIQGQTIVSTCDCPSPSTQIKNFNGTSFACKCPAGQGYSTSLQAGTVYGQNGTSSTVSTLVGSCTPCPLNSFVGGDGQCSACAIGQKPGKLTSSSPMGCVPACASGSVLSGNTCQACPAGTFAYSPYNSSLGMCKACPDGETSSPAATSCYSKCKEWEEWDGSSKSCKAICPEGKRWAFTGEFKHSCLSCPDGREYLQSNNSCVSCPTNMTWGKNDKGIGVCQCPSGTTRTGNICVPTTPGSAKPNSSFAVDEDKLTPPPSCPMGWGWSAKKQKCMPGLNTLPPPSSRSAPPSGGGRTGRATAPSGGTILEMPLEIPIR